MAPLKSHPAARHFRHLGTIWAFDVATDSPSFARDFYLAGLQRGVLLRPMGTTVYCMPPYIVTPDDMAFVTSSMLSILEELAP